MVNLVRVKRKRGLPSPAERLYVDVQDGNDRADDLLRGLSLTSASGDGAGPSRPRTKRYRRIVGDVTLLELDALEFRDGFETGGRTGAGVAVPEEGEGDNGARGSNNKRRASMTYSVVKRRREEQYGPSFGGAGLALHGQGQDLDPLRRLGHAYRVCDLEFTPSTPDAKSKIEDVDDLYDLYVEDDVWEAAGEGGSCAVVCVEDCDFFIPEFDEDRDDSVFDSEDSNAEDYFLNDYPEEEEEDDEDNRLVVGCDGWDSDGYEDSGSDHSGSDIDYY